MQEKRASVALNMFNNTAQGKVAELVKNKDGLYSCRIKEETTCRDLNLSNIEEKVLYDQIQQINEDYLVKKNSAIKSDVLGAITLVGGFCCAVLLAVNGFVYLSNK